MMAKTKNPERAVFGITRSHLNLDVHLALLGLRRLQLLLQLGQRLPLLELVFRKLAVTFLKNRTDIIFKNIF
jgi:hypothetical protein